VFSAGQLMGWTEQYYWPFLRISAMFLASPIFSAPSFPVRARVLLALAITALVTPSLASPPTIDMLGPAGILLAGQQVVIGLAMGFLVQLVFSAVIIAGQTLSMSMGLGFAMSVDPQNGVQVPVVSQMYMIFATLVFLGVNGHLVLIELLINSFTLLPVGLNGLGDTFALDIVLWGGQMFQGALLLVLPALTAVLLINIAFGVITRAAPQLNIFAVGFPVTILAGFIFMFLTLPSVLSLIIELFDTGLAQAFQLIR
jgi:flagellar biosynthetic protein FliR